MLCYMQWISPPLGDESTLVPRAFFKWNSAWSITRAVEVSGLVLKFRAWDFCFKWDRSDLSWSIPVDIRSVVLLARSEVPWGLQNLRCRE
jgi:hypothetical protein